MKLSNKRRRVGQSLDASAPLVSVYTFHPAALPRSLQQSKKTPSAEHQFARVEGEELRRSHGSSTGTALSMRSGEAAEYGVHTRLLRDITQSCMRGKTTVWQIRPRTTLEQVADDLVLSECLHGQSPTSERSFLLSLLRCCRGSQSAECIPDDPAPRKVPIKQKSTTSRSAPLYHPTPGAPEPLGLNPPQKRMGILSSSFSVCLPRVLSRRRHRGAVLARAEA